MAVHYTFDADLDMVLQAASNADLDPLVDFIVNNHITENLSTSEEFKRFFPAHHHYVHIISHELRAFGGNSIANFIRKGRGPDYRTVVCDVAKHFQLKFASDDHLPLIEQKIIAHVMKEIYNNMTKEQKQIFIAEVQQYQDNNGAMVVAAVELEDFSSLSNKAIALMSLLVSNTVSHIMGARSLVPLLVGPLEQSFTKLRQTLRQPLQWLKQMLYHLYELGGARYRVTVPCVVHIAMLRIKQSSNIIEYHAPNPDTQLNHQKTTAKEDSVLATTTENEPSAEMANENVAKTKTPPPLRRKQSLYSRNHRKISRSAPRHSRTKTMTASITTQKHNAIIQSPSKEDPIKNNG